MLCLCNSKEEFAKCCEPYLNNSLNPSTPQQLMRSRYSAYALGNGEYIVKTTTSDNRFNDDVELIKEYAKNISWLNLQIIHVEECFVEFKAYYRDTHGIKVQHEKSRFVLENGVWLYKDGEVFNSKIDRNEACPCKSGKKYKKCCIYI